MTKRDLNLGITVKTHPSTGKIWRWKDDPSAGYFDWNDQPVSVEVARQAGFDTEADAAEVGRERIRQQAVEDARRTVPDQEPQTVAERGRYAVISTGLGFHSLSRDGDPLADRLTREAAMRLLGKVAGHG